MQPDCATIWNECLEILRHEVDEQNYNTWFKPIVPIQAEGDVLTIQVPSQFFYEWLEENYVPVLKKAVNTVLGPTGKLEYSVIVDSGNKQNPPLTINYPNGLKNRGNGPSRGNGEVYSPFSYRQVNPQPVNSRLNSAYTFENFVEGDCNRLARSAGVAVAKKPGVTSFNPLMLYGGV
ncbi:MAG: DnaA N-terminal domain-containing protein, partial [Bacteroidota bacterium]